MYVGGFVGKRIPADTLLLEPLFAYLEDLEPGETLEIDAEDLAVELDGNNARKDFQGDYPFLKLGLNKFRYYDDETSRQISIEIEKNDRTI